MPGKSGALTADQLSSIEAFIVKYIADHPDDNFTDGATVATMRAAIAQSTKIGAIQLVKPVNDIVRKLTSDDPPAPAKSTPAKVGRRSINDDPASSSESGKPSASAGASTGSAAGGRRTLGKAPVAAPVANTSNRKPRMSTTSSANKANTAAASKSSNWSGLPNQVHGLCINVDALPYNADADLTESDYAEEISAEDAFGRLVETIMPDIAEEFVTKTYDYTQAIDALKAKYPTADITDANGKTKKAKPQIIKCSHGANGYRVSYINPTDLKAAELKAAEAKPIIEYFKYVDEIVAPKVPTFSAPKAPKAPADPNKPAGKGARGKPAAKPAAPKPDPDADLGLCLEVLQNDFVYTPSIFNAAWFKKVIPGMDEDFIKPLGFFRADAYPSNDDIDKHLAPVSDIDYIGLFNAIAKIPTAKMANVTKAVYLARAKLCRMISTVDRQDIWFQAVNNINSLTDEAIAKKSGMKQFADHVTKFDADIIHTWQRLLQSRYVFNLIAKGIPANPLFEKPFLRLITHPTSIRLFMTALYPIACYFTPFHCFYNVDALSPTKIPDNVTSVTYNKHIKKGIEQLLTARGFDFTQERWIYYIKKCDSEQVNAMIKLLGPYILAKSVPVAKGAKAAATVDANASDKGDADDMITDGGEEDIGDDGPEIGDDDEGDGEDNDEDLE